MLELSKAGTPPASIELISGPSRTSDIEIDLSIGVHGPVEVYLIVMHYFEWETENAGIDE